MGKRIDKRRCIEQWCRYDEVWGGIEWYECMTEREQMMEKQR